MRVAALAVCLLILSAGCIVQTTESGPETATPSTPERIDEKAKAPIHPKTPSAAEYDVEVNRIEDLVHQKINERRIAHGLNPLNRSKNLDAIARYKSWDMAQRDYFGHKGPNGVTHKMMRNKYHSGCAVIGQNIQKHPEGVKSIQMSGGDVSIWSENTVSALMNSTGHRKNILDPDYDVQGIGVFVDENGTVYLTQEFCG